MTIRRRLNQFVRYAMTGGAAAVVDLGVFSAICPAVLKVATAATVSFALAAVVNYVLTTLFVFESAFGLRKFLKFYAFATVGLVFNVSVTVLVAELTPAPPPLAKVIGIGAAFLFNFWLNAAFVFRERASSCAGSG